jgi:hypothetical protein
MRRRIDTERHAAHYKPAACSTDRCDASRGGEAVSARPSCANDPDRRESQYSRVTVQPEWSTTILVWLQAEPRLTVLWYAWVIWIQTHQRAKSTDAT